MDCHSANPLVGKTKNKKAEQEGIEE